MTFFTGDRCVFTLKRKTGPGVVKTDYRPTLCIVATVTLVSQCSLVLVFLPVTGIALAGCLPILGFLMARVTFCGNVLSG